MRVCDNCPRYMKKDCKLYERNIESLSRDELEHDLIMAITELYRNDYDLINRDLSERCLVSYIFHYFWSIHESKYKALGYRFDTEYNRNGIEAKYYYGYEEKNKYAIPDAIIHVRNCNKYNLLYMEFKKNLSNVHDSVDKEKIIKFISDEILNNEDKRHGVKPYRFKYGLSINLNSKDISLMWFEKGNETGEVVEYDYKDNCFVRRCN